MIQLIVGSKGSGKTKTMVEMINAAAKQASGNIVCIEKGMKLTYDLDYNARLVDMDEYGITTYDMLFGFVAGMRAGNYDIQEIYIDGVRRIEDGDLEKLGVLLDEIAGACEDIKVVFTISADEAELPEGVKKYM